MQAVHGDLIQHRDEFNGMAARMRFSMYSRFRRWRVSVSYSPCISRIGRFSRGLFWQAANSRQWY